RAMHPNGHQRPTIELTVEDQQDKRRSEHDLLQIVRHHKAAHALLNEYGLPHPTTLRDWRAVEEQFEVADDIALMLRRVLPPAIAIPSEPHYRRFLVEFWEKAELYQRERVRSIAYDPYIYLGPDETPQQVIRALIPQLRAIQRRLVLSDEEMTT